MISLLRFFLKLKKSFINKWFRIRKLSFIFVNKIRMIKMFPKNAIKKPLLNNKGWSPQLKNTIIEYVLISFMLYISILAQICIVGMTRVRLRVIFSRFSSARRADLKVRSFSSSIWVLICLPSNIQYSQKSKALSDI